MNNSKANQKILVRELGEQIGYGNLMHLASECWQESLKAKGLPPGGAFSVGLPYDLLVKNESEDDWISVKVRLPEKDGWVICGRTGAKQSFPAWFNGNPLLHPVYGNEHFFIDNRAVHPDAWQYLPEPPKE